MARTMQGYGELIQEYESKIEELSKIGLENAEPKHDEADQE